MEYHIGSFVTSHSVEFHYDFTCGMHHFDQFIDEPLKSSIEDHEDEVVSSSC